MSHPTALSELTVAFVNTNECTPGEELRWQSVPVYELCARQGGGLGASRWKIRRKGFLICEMLNYDKERFQHQSHWIVTKQELIEELEVNTAAAYIKTLEEMLQYGTAVVNYPCGQ